MYIFVFGRSFQVEFPIAGLESLDTVESRANLSGNGDPAHESVIGAS